MRKLYMNAPVLQFLLLGPFGKKPCCRYHDVLDYPVAAVHAGLSNEAHSSKVFTMVAQGTASRQASLLNERARPVATVQMCACDVSKLAGAEQSTHPVCLSNNRPCCYHSCSCT